MNINKNRQPLYDQLLNLLIEKSKMKWKQTQCFLRKRAVKALRIKSDHRSLGSTGVRKIRLYLSPTWQRHLCLGYPQAGNQFIRFV